MLEAQLRPKVSGRGEHVFLDGKATKPLRPRRLGAMLPYLIRRISSLADLPHASSALLHAHAPQAAGRVPCNSFTVSTTRQTECGF
jgi:cysteine sulfinate desulfinase/cysteine desulfurase-like protein